ncbi:hypothetical protein OKW21_002390 [Catalinimonas alkaloidigena]|uniref:DUF6265 family protein n=1 Tax=Catalinimonas alkaloidigena TaxID=1075417 RepID=UPI0024068A4A|nr:DUF6265 family protein [Catalinimonas alkaloidigena]MDF9797127.1 hypothetical protein [Catalinimonas alkaloidigena]
MRKIILLCLMVFSTTKIFAQNSGNLTDIEFIAGHWQTNKDGSTIEAFWTEAEGDNMVGVVRMIKEDKATLYEMFAIEMTDSGLEVKVKHFKPGLIGLEAKDNYDHYTFLESSKGRAVFEKQGNDIRVLYEKRPGNKFAIAIGKPVNGEWKFEDFWVFTEMK